MEEVKLNSHQKLKKALKYDLLISIPKRMNEKAFKSLKNKSFLKFYLEYKNLYTQWENLSINFKNHDLSILKTFLLNIQESKINDKIHSLTINFDSDRNLPNSTDFDNEFELLTNFVSNLNKIYHVTKISNNCIKICIFYI